MRPRGSASAATSVASMNNDERPRQRGDRLAIEPRAAAQHHGHEADRAPDPDRTVLTGLTRQRAERDGFHQRQRAGREQAHQPDHPGDALGERDQGKSRRGHGARRGDDGAMRAGAVGDPAPGGRHDDARDRRQREHARRSPPRSNRGWRDRAENTPHSRRRRRRTESRTPRGGTPFLKLASARMSRSAFYVLFTASGFAGLIYESVWTHYLKLFLGHAAYAQSLVLAVFMGGMAAGAAWCARRSARLANPLAVYARGRGGGRPRVARVPSDVRRASPTGPTNGCFPAWAGSGSRSARSSPLSCALILPQSVLLGMTFPLMSAGLARAHRGRAGESLAMLYFTNSLGAAVGVLASGFVLDRLASACPARCSPRAASTSPSRSSSGCSRGRRATSPIARTRPRARNQLAAAARGRLLHRPGVVRLRDQLDPHALAGARRLDALVRGDARHLHLRPGARRPGRAPARRYRASSRCGCWPGCRWRWGSPPRPRCRCTTSPSG